MNKRFIVVAVLAIAMLAGFATQAFAATGDIIISAQVASKITVTAPGDHDFGLVDPAAGVQTHASVVNVRSNVAYTMAQAEAGDASGLFASAGPAMNGSSSNAKAPSAAGFDWAQTWSFDPAAGGDWADPGSYSATYTYTALTF